MVPISDRLSRLRRGITLRATLVCPQDEPANRHLGLGMWGARTHVPPRAETECTVQVGQYAKTKKITKERVGALKMGCSQPTIRLKPRARVREPDVLCDRTLWPSGGLAHGRALALPPLRPTAAIAADRGNGREESWPPLGTALGRVGRAQLWSRCVTPGGGLSMRSIPEP